MKKLILNISILVFLSGFFINADAQNSDPIFTIGTKWTYDFSWLVPGGPFGQDDLAFGIFVITVTDTIRQNDSLIYFLKNNRFPNRTNLMYQEDDKIYLREGAYWQLTYDFSNPENYHSIFFNPFINQIDTAIVNVGLQPDAYDFGDRGLQTIQNLTIDNNGTYENMPVTVDVLHHCGNLYGGLSLGLGLALADPPYIIGKLRCFKKGDFQHNFTGNEGDSTYITCDSVRYISSIKDEVYKTVNISPNPFSGQLKIELQGNERMTGWLVNSSGQIVQVMEINNSRMLDGLESLPPGFYAFVLSDQQGNVLYVKKLIKE